MKLTAPTAVWILAKLYDEEDPIGRKPLLKKLCQASFDLMNEGTEFSNTLAQLEKEKYVEQSYGTEKGYEITEDGIIAFRRNFGTPFEKIKNRADKLPELKNSKFSLIVKTIKDSSDATTTAAKLCIDNAPLVLEFLMYARSELTKLGINIG